MLGTLALAGNHNTCRNVSESDRRISTVNVLTTSTACSVCVDPKVAFFHFNFNRIVDHWRNKHRGKTRMTSSIGIKRTNPNEPMNTGLNFQKSKGVQPGNTEGGILNSSTFAI